MRKVILHYHLFKNAGTSLDQILRQNFSSRWVTTEFPPNRGNNTDLVSDWIREREDAVAFSSHTMLGPIPQIDGAEVIPVVLLRDPIARIRSAYSFERKQQADTLGAKLAKEHDFSGYVCARLKSSADRQCRNFQTDRLASMSPGDAPELERALRTVDKVSAQGVLGFVDRFDETVQKLAQKLVKDFPDFTWESVRANVSKAAEQEPLSDLLSLLLNEVNRDDLALFETAQSRLIG